MRKQPNKSFKADAFGAALTPTLAARRGMLNFLKSVLISIVISSAIAAGISYFSSAKLVPTTFFIWGALFLNARVATWEDAMPGGFDNSDGKTPLELQGWGKLKFWSITLVGTAALVGAGIYFLNQRL